MYFAFWQIQIIPVAMAHVKPSRHLLPSYNVAVTPLSKPYVRRASLQLRTTRRLLFLIHRNLPSRTRNRRARKQARQGAPHVGCRHARSSGWASFWWRLVRRTPVNASEENENGFRLFACRPRRRRLAGLLDFRPAAA